MQHLFAYGTLMCQDILQEVSGCRLQPESGLLEGYCRKAVKGEQYPGITPDSSDRVGGVVYRGVPDSAWERLDRFEGPMYFRQQVTVALSAGGTIQATVYVVRPEYLPWLTEQGWDFERFLNQGKTSFQNHYSGYRSL
jgi:gamma-glutamylcyclotransferase (GGCT)/AIG2-like uncharacterized protein YtfP